MICSDTVAFSNSERARPAAAWCRDKEAWGFFGALKLKSVRQRLSWPTEPVTFDSGCGDADTKLVVCWYASGRDRDRDGICRQPRFVPFPSDADHG